MKKKIIVIGGTGFIGFNLIKKIPKKNFEITSVSRKLPSKGERIKKVRYIKCDISKYNELKRLKEDNFDYIINLGGNIDHKNKTQTDKVHFAGCKNLIKFFNNKKKKLFIQIGSSLEYGSLKSPHFERKKSSTRSIYGNAKLKATNYIKKFTKKNNLNFLVLRLYQVYGPYQKFDRLIPFVIKNSLNNEKFYCTDGKQYRDFLFIDDLVRLFMIIFKMKNINSGIYNVGTGKPEKIKKIINLIIKFTKKGNPQFGKLKMRKDEIIRSYPSINKIVKEFKWRPIVNINSGLIKTIRFYSGLNTNKYTYK